MDVADGQTLTNVDVTTTLPDDVLITGVTAPGGTVVITGTNVVISYATLNADETVTLNYYVLDNDGVNDVIDPLTGTEVAVPLNVTATGD